MRIVFIWVAGLAAVVVVAFLALRSVAPCLLSAGLPGAAAACADKTAAASRPKLAQPLPPLVGVVTAERRTFRRRLFVSGTLTARDEAIVGAQIEGLRIVAVLAEDGDHVTAGQVLARLDRSQLEALLAQNDAARARSAAAIEQARSQITQTETTLAQAATDLERTQKLSTQVVSQATIDQRMTAFRGAEAQVAASRAALAAAEADGAARAAERRELMVRIGRTEVKAPVAGVVSRRTAKVGAMATGQEGLFRIITDGAIDLNAEVAAEAMATLKVGMAATIAAPGTEEPITGRVRLISEEVDPATRTGKVRIALPADKGLRVGAFASGTVLVAERDGLAVPASAITVGGDGPSAQIVVDGRIVRRAVVVGITEGRDTEILSGLDAGDTVVARAAAFLRQGDLVRAAPDGGAGGVTGGGRTGS
jgi:RND family efflux transporter MFP subunit